MTFVRIRSAKSTATSTLRPAACAVLRPAVLGLLALLCQAPLRAQQATILRANESFLADPGGVRLGRLAEGTRVAVGPARSGHTSVTLEGWVFAQSLQPANRDGHNLQVRHAPEENLRESPNGRIVARLVQGCLLDEVERRNGWVKVRRSGWVATGAVQPARPAAAAPPARAGAATPQRAADTAAVPQVVEVDPRRAVVRRRLQFYRGPGESPAGALDAGTPVRITARAGDWVRVEAQGWVRENEIRMADSSILNGVSAAELRGAPEEFRGKLLRWTIQFVALQTADELRPDFLPGQRYILARGPAPEYAFVYILVPREKLAEVQRLQPLASVEIVARVLNGRSTYLANPILELVDIAQ
jgi:hypothetical protein